MIISDKMSFVNGAYCVILRLIAKAILDSSISDVLYSCCLQGWRNWQTH